MLSDDLGGRGGGGGREAQEGRDTDTASYVYLQPIHNATGRNQHNIVKQLFSN